MAHVGGPVYVAGFAARNPNHRYVALTSQNLTHHAVFVHRVAAYLQIPHTDVLRA